MEQSRRRRQASRPFLHFLRNENPDLAGRACLPKQPRRRQGCRPSHTVRKEGCHFIFLSRSLMSLSFISASSEKNESQRNCNCLLCRSTTDHRSTDAVSFRVRPRMTFGLHYVPPTLPGMRSSYISCFFSSSPLIFKRSRFKKGMHVKGSNIGD